MPVRIVLFLTIVFLATGKLSAGNNDLSSMLSGSSAYDSLPLIKSDSLSLSILSDTVRLNDTLSGDSIRSDSISTSRIAKKSTLKEKVVYNSVDSMRVAVADEKLYLYGEAFVQYQNIELKAHYIELDLKNEEVFAKGTVDTAGVPIGRPDFKQGGQNFQADSLRYNFSTEKGIIYHIITKQGEGYLHSDKTKRLSNEHINMQDGKYTTCDAEHPHFYMALRKGIVIPEDKIITGYAYMVIADVPIKVAGIPFGFFPNTTERASGILIPAWGEEESRGFFLRDFGWYQVLGKYADLRLMGDYYSKGSWASKNTLAYKVKYRFSGNLFFSYAATRDKDDITFENRNDFSVRWNHRQDAKANPTQNFSASVDFKSGRYDQLHADNSQQYLSNNTSSSINYTKRWPGSPFNLSLSANANQNRQTEEVSLNMPTGSFNMSSIYPLRKKTGTGSYKWFENISVSYNSKFENKLNTYNKVLFEQEALDSMRNGFQHNIPLSVPFKLGKVLTISPSLSYNGVLYTQHIEIDPMVDYDTATGDFTEHTDTIKEITYEQAINPGLGISFTPKLYGMLISKKDDSYVEAIRHVMSPSASFSFTPDMQNINSHDYYDSLYYMENDSVKFYRQYNQYEDDYLSLYSPPASSGKSGSLRLALNNNLEMKVRPKNDTTGESKKVVLLDNLNLSTSWNPFKDSLRWNDVAMVTGTKLFNNKFDIRMNGSFSPYACDSAGKKYNTFYYNETKHLLRFTSLSISSSFSLRSGQADKNDGKGAKDQADAADEDITEQDQYIEDDMDYVAGHTQGTYADFNIPWSLTVQHNWSLNKAGINSTTVNTLRVSGDFSLTPKWKIGGQLHYDIEKNEVSYTSLNIFRDLHCWEMRFTVIPFGDRRSYSFTIQAKGSLLQDLKYEKKPNWIDNMY